MKTRGSFIIFTLPVFLILFGISELLPAQSKNNKIQLDSQTRIDYQEKLERIYWQNRIWPKENLQPKPSFLQIISAAQIRNKVENSLKKSSALKVLWNIPVKGERLQAELNRISKTTKDPRRLRELFQVLNDDPEVICETLIRPIVVDELIRQAYSFDNKLHSLIREQALFSLNQYQTIDELRQFSGEYSQIEFTRDSLSNDQWNQILEDIKDIPIQIISKLKEDESSFYVLSVLHQTEDSIVVGAIRWKKVPFDEWWKTVEDQFEFDQPESFTYQLPEISGNDCADDSWSPTIVNPPSKRILHIAVWTGSEMIIWGGYNGNYPLNSGGRYDPVTDTWVPTNLTNAPTLSNRNGVWSGSELIVWDGITRVGARYNPASDTWVTIDNTGAPPSASANTVVWSGTEMITFGWTGPTNVGGKYNPISNSWSPVSAVNAASARFNHSAIWTGIEMVIWGGFGCPDPPDCNQSYDRLNTGGRYNPVSDTWSPTNTANAPTGREFHSGTWTGSKMIVWGGDTNAGSTDTGGIYDPVTDQWIATNVVGAPTARSKHTAVWTGNQMIVWGWVSDFSGGIYDPTTDLWTPTSQNGAPPVFQAHSAIWTGSEMIIWGGLGNNGLLKSGSRYNPATDSWIPTNSSGTPTERLLHTAVWTGTEMIVWGGEDTNTIPYSNTGGRYDPALDSWISTSTINVPEGRYDHTAVWTGTEMIVWGGFGSSFYLNSGGKYNPATDTWLDTSTTNVPSVRSNHTAIWTGSQMIVWGGAFGLTFPTIGGRYNPSSDSWQLTSDVNVPFGRSTHSAVWTGTKMIIWGGHNFTQEYLQDGGVYNLATDQWAPTSLTQAPEQRRRHTAVWTGNKMVVWGGDNGSNVVSTGGQYDPVSDSWTDVETVGAPSARADHTAVWANDRMIIWGGQGADYYQTGGRYDPNTNSWSGTSILNAPDARAAHSATWTGSQMIVWGGTSAVPYATGGLYCHVSEPPPCLLSDDFEDGTIDPSIWTIVKDSWQESGGELVGTPARRKAFIFASGFAGCDNCTIQTSVSISSGTLAKVWIIGWYQDKNNKVELLLKEDSDRLILKQRSNGIIVRKQKAILQIDPNVTYTIQLSFDGTTFHVSVDNVEVLTVPAGSVPFGTAGYQVKNTTAHFGSICVN